MDGGSVEQGVACQYHEAHAREAFKRVNFFRIGYQRYQVEAHFPQSRQAGTMITRIALDAMNTTITSHDLPTALSYRPRETTHPR